MSAEISNCSFCGAKAKVRSLRRGDYKRVGDNYQVTCNRCRCRGPLVQDSKAQAVHLWNCMQAGVKWKKTESTK